MGLDLIRPNEIEIKLHHTKINHSIGYSICATLVWFQKLTRFWFVQIASRLMIQEVYYSVRNMAIFRCSTKCCVVASWILPTETYIAYFVVHQGVQRRLYSNRQTGDESATFWIVCEHYSFSSRWTMIIISEFQYVAVYTGHFYALRVPSSLHSAVNSGFAVTIITHRLFAVLVCEWLGSLMSWWFASRPISRTVSEIYSIR